MTNQTEQRDSYYGQRMYRGYLISHNSEGTYYTRCPGDCWFSLRAPKDLGQNIGQVIDAHIREMHDGVSPVRPSETEAAR